MKINDVLKLASVVIATKLALPQSTFMWFMVQFSTDNQSTKFHFLIKQGT